MSINKLYRITTKSVGNRERIELQGREITGENGAWSMMKGYNLSVNISPSEMFEEIRKSIFALIGIASSQYALTFQDLEVTEELMDYISD